MNFKKEINEIVKEFRKEFINTLKDDGDVMGVEDTIRSFRSSVENVYKTIADLIEPKNETEIYVIKSIYRFLQLPIDDKMFLIYTFSKSKENLGPWVKECLFNSKNDFKQDLFYNELDLRNFYWKDDLVEYTSLDSFISNFGIDEYEYGFNKDFDQEEWKRLFENDYKCFLVTYLKYFKKNGSPNRIAHNKINTSVILDQGRLFNEGIDYLFLKNTYYLPFLYFYLSHYKNNEYKGLQFYPFDLISHLLLNCMEELLVFIEQLFDYIFAVTTQDDRLFYAMIKAIKFIDKELITQIIKIQQKNIFLDSKNINDYNAEWQFIVNRANYFDSLAFLCNSSKVDRKKRSYYWLDPEVYETHIQDMGVNELCSHCFEFEDFDTSINSNRIRTFRNHRKILLGLQKLFEARSNNGAIIVPNISIDLDLDKLIDFKIAHNEFFIMKKEYKENHKKLFKADLEIPKILKAMVNDSSHLDIPYDYNETSSFTNQRNFYLFRVSKYLTEKVRRGYYREFRKTKYYEDLFETKQSIYNIFKMIVFIPDLEIQCDFFCAYYIDLISNLIFQLNDQISVRQTIESIEKWSQYIFQNS